jgi:hypothetical protein
MSQAFTFQVASLALSTSAVALNIRTNNTAKHAETIVDEEISIDQLPHQASMAIPSTLISMKQPVAMDQQRAIITRVDA